jgi:hypothetical protein
MKSEWPAEVTLIFNNVDKFSDGHPNATRESLFTHIQKRDLVARVRVAHFLNCQLT